MHDFAAYKRTAIRYWEFRRIIYNLALVPPAWLGYCFVDNWNWVGDPHETDYAYIIPIFALATAAANICYTFAYVFEFLFGNDAPTSRWHQFGRPVIFGIGTLLAMWLALTSGTEIAGMAWGHRFR